jgi:membrane protease YdiL (CAAX protease family)
MFRGFALRALEDRGHRFWTANGIAALMILGLHLPGWSFMGRLRASLAAAGVSLVAGYAKHRGRSTWAAIAVHFLNNVYSAVVG